MAACLACSLHSTGLAGAVTACDPSVYVHVDVRLDVCCIEQNLHCTHQCAPFSFQ